MPHAVFPIGSQTADGRSVPRTLIPGIEPGGSLAGREAKPALLIKDCWLQVRDFTIGGATDFNSMAYGLLLSQDRDLNPALELPIALVGAELDEATAVGQNISGVGQLTEQLFKAQGTTWVPAYIGVRHDESGTITINADVHLDYEQVMVPWMDWFIMWDFLDNITDLTREY